MSEKPRLCKGDPEALKKFLDEQHPIVVMGFGPPSVSPVFEFSYCDDGRLVICCGDEMVMIQPDGVARLKDFLSQINLKKGVDHV